MAKADRTQLRELEQLDEGAISMLITMLRGYYWLEEAVRSYVVSRGAPDFTRSQGMVMASIILGIHHPSEIARQLDVSRQAIHTTLRQMVRKGIVRLSKDPNNNRVVLAHLTEFGTKMRYDGRDAMQIIVEEIGQRIGRTKMRELSAALNADWGPALTFSPDQDYRRGYRKAVPIPRSQTKSALKKKKD